MSPMNLFTKGTQNHRCRRQTYGHPSPKGGGRDKLRSCDWHIHTTIYKIYIHTTIYKIDN